MTLVAAVVVGAGVGGGVVPVGIARANPSGAVTPVSVNGLPAGADAVLVNIAMVDGTSPGYIAADRCSALVTGAPNRANGNFDARAAIANLAVVPVAPDGQFCIYNQAPVQLVVDLQGAFAPVTDGGELYVPDTGRRVRDTRTTSPTPLAAGSITAVDTGLPAGTDAALVNIAMVDGTAPGYITADRCSSLTAGPQTRANGNHLVDTAIANLAVVPVDGGGRFCIYNQARVHLIVDVQGSFTHDSPAGLGFAPMTGGRVSDTRTASSTPPVAGSITVVDTGAPAGTQAVLVDIAMVDATSPGYITADRCSTLAAGPQTRASGNHAIGAAIANLAVVPVDAGGRFCIYNQAPVHLVVDVQGRFAADAPDRFVSLTSARLLDTRPAAPVAQVAVPGTTSCTSVVHIGDSTSVGLIASSMLHNPDDRMPAQYRRVGVSDPRMEISGARSIVERLPGQENAYEVAVRLKASGYHGCWVLALGTTDSANIAAGSSIGRAWRIDRMMSVLGADPVLWVNVKTTEAAGPWSNNAMAPWNLALVEAAVRYPNIIVYDWAAAAQTSWFSTDRVHYTSEGFRIRAQLIANALAVAYPD